MWEQNRLQFVCVQRLMCRRPGIQYAGGVEYRGKWYIFGGRVQHQLTNTIPQHYSQSLSNQLWCYDFSSANCFLLPVAHSTTESMKWSEIQCKGEVPPPIYGHSLCIYK